MSVVPALDLKAQYAQLRSELRGAVDSVLESQNFILGSEVASFETEIAEFLGARFAVGLSSGTDSLLVALMAAGVGPGDEVITSCYTFFATAGVIARLGARPVFVDIDPVSFNLNSDMVPAMITSRTKAIMPVHLFGQCAAMDPLLVSASAQDIPVIEDAAQAIGARDAMDRNAGSIGLGGCLSFYPSKNLGAFGDGGLLATNSEDFAGKVRLLRVHGASPKYYHSMIGGNFRLDALQAAVLRVKLRHLASWTEARRNNAHRYRSLFRDNGLLESVSLPTDVPGHVYNQFVVRVPDRDALAKFLAGQGVETAVYYPLPLHLQPCFVYLGYRKGDFPEAESAADDSLALPMYPELTESQQEYVVSKIKEFYSR